MTGQIRYEFTATLWQHHASGGWHFVSLPEEIASEIRTFFKSMEEGWGRLKATATIGRSTWTTAIWFDTKRETYLLPVKAAVRLKEHLHLGDEIKILLLV